jgi:hypothetical protein
MYMCVCIYYCMYTYHAHTYTYMTSWTLGKTQKKQLCQHEHFYAWASNSQPPGSQSGKNKHAKTFIGLIAWPNLSKGKNRPGRWCMPVIPPFRRLRQEDWGQPGLYNKTLSKKKKIKPKTQKANGFLARNLKRHFTFRALQRSWAANVTGRTFDYNF